MINLGHPVNPVKASFHTSRAHCSRRPSNALHPVHRKSSRRARAGTSTTRVSRQSVQARRAPESHDPKPFVRMPATKNLISEISSRTDAAPCRSIARAVCNTSNRAALISARLSAIHSCTFWRLPSNTPGDNSLSRGVAAHQIKRSLADSDPAHAMMNSSWSKPFLRDRKAFAFLSKQVTLRHATVFVSDFRMTRVITALVTHDVDVSH